MRSCLIHLFPVFIAAALNAHISGDTVNELDSSFAKNPSSAGGYDQSQFKPNRLQNDPSGNRPPHPWKDPGSKIHSDEQKNQPNRPRQVDVDWKEESDWHQHESVDCYNQHPEDDENDDRVPTEETIVYEVNEKNDPGKGSSSVRDNQPDSNVAVDSEKSNHNRRHKHHDEGKRHKLKTTRRDRNNNQHVIPSKKDIHSNSRDHSSSREGKFSSSRVKPFKEKKTILVIGDEIVHYLRGEQLYGLCYVQTESYEGLTVADSTDRLQQLIQSGAFPDRVIVHVGANDLVLRSPNTPYLVSQRLKALWYLFKNTQPKISSQIFLSSVLPRPDDISDYNTNVATLHYKMRSFANREGLGYIDHYSGFMRDGAVKDELYRFDGTLNESGMKKFERVLFEDCDEGKESSSIIRKKPSLELKDILPLDRKNYDKHVPPKKDGSPTTAYFHVTVLSVDSIDEESMTYVADIFLAQSWHDHRLRLPENMTEGYRILDVDWLKHIWRPDSFIKNAKKVTFHDMSVPNHYLWLYYDKTLLYMTKLTLEMSCAMKFEAYPHDTQICSLMIESLSHTTDDLVFVWNVTDPLVVYPDIELPQLDIVDNKTEDCTLQYSTGNFTCLAVVFNLKRRVGYHLFHTYIPTTLIVVMSWISFWIRPEAIPARVTLGVTSLLTLATQNTQSQSSLPPVSYVKAIDVWMSSCTVFVFMSLMEFALVNHYLGNIATTKIMRGYSMDDGTMNGSQMLGSLPRNNNGNTNTDGMRTRSRPNGGLRPAAPSRQDSIANMFAPRVIQGQTVDLTNALAIDKFSRFFFPLSFAVLNIVYWFNYAKL